MKTEFILLWLASLEKSDAPLAALDPETWKMFDILPVKTASKRNGDIQFYYVPRKQLIRALVDKYQLRKKCTLNY